MWIIIPQGNQPFVLSLFTFQRGMRLPKGKWWITRCSITAYVTSATFRITHLEHCGSLFIRLQKCTSCRNEKNLHGFKYWRYCLCGRTISSHLVRGLEYQAEGMNSIRSVIFKLLLISMCHKLHSIILNLNFKLLIIKAFDRWSRSIIA